MHGIVDALILHALSASGPETDGAGERLLGVSSLQKTQQATC